MNYGKLALTIPQILTKHKTHHPRLGAYYIYRMRKHHGKAHTERMLLPVKTGTQYSTGNRGWDWESTKVPQTARDRH
jgi:hypothetical protein